MLDVPSAETAQAVAPAEARQSITAQSADFGAYRQRLAGAVAGARDAEPTRRQAAARCRPRSRTRSRRRTGARQADAEQGRRAQPQGRRQREDRLSRARSAGRRGACRRAEQERQRPEAADPGTRRERRPRRPRRRPRRRGTAPAVAATRPAAVAAPRVVTPVPTPTAPTAPPAPPRRRPHRRRARVVATAPPAASAAAVPPVSQPRRADAAPLGSAATRADAASLPRAAPLAAVAARPARAVVAAEAAGRAGCAPPRRSRASSTRCSTTRCLGARRLLALLLAGFGFYRSRSSARRTAARRSFLESRLQPDSFFGASGGQRIDTRDAGGSSSSMTYSLSQLDAIGDVDPVAEADVYLAYGRDLQAEEILKEAMRSNPERLAIRTKLLEVYAKRRDTKGFELLATQLYALTRGEGEDWAKAQELGARDRSRQSRCTSRAARPAAGGCDGGATSPSRSAPARCRNRSCRSPSQFGALDAGRPPPPTAPSTSSTSTSTTRTSARAVGAGGARRDAAVRRREPGRADDVQPTHAARCRSSPTSAGAQRRHARRAAARSTFRASRSISTSRPRRPAAPTMRSTASRRCRRSTTTAAIRWSRKLELAEEFRADRRQGRRARPAAEVLAKADGATEDQGAEACSTGSAEARRAPRPARAGDASASRESRPRHRLPRQRLPAAGRASPAAARCRTSSKRRSRASPTGRSRTVCAGRTDAGVHALNQVVHFDTDVEREAVLLGARHQPLPAGRHRRAMGRAGRRRLPRARQRARPALRLRAARVAGAAGVEAGRVGWTFRPLDGDAMRAAARALLGEHDFSAFRSRRMPGDVAGEDAARARDRAARRLLALRLRRQRLPAPHDPQHHGLPGRGRQRRATAALARATCWPRATATRAAPTFAPDGLYFVGPVLRCRPWRLPERTAGASTGCPERADAHRRGSARASRSAA